MHEEYMRLALDEARRALQRGEFPVGCVLADEKGIVCSGRRENSSEKNEVDHAEMMALRNLYRHHADRAGGRLTVYATMEPCLMCFSALLLNNVRTIVYAYEDVMGGGTNLSLPDLRPLYASMRIEVIPHILREESLELFRRFFVNDTTGYWQDSLLADYTLKQKPKTLPDDR